MSKKHELPGWFPFAILASAVVAIAAGARAGWKLQGASPSPAPTPNAPVQAGVIHDWAGVRFG